MPLDAAFFNEYLGWIAVIAFFGFVALLVYRKTRGVPPNPDFIKVFKTMFIDDEKYNIPDKTYGVQYLYRGTELLGRIVSLSENVYNIAVKTAVAKTDKNDFRDKTERAETRVVTVCFRPVWFRTPLFRRPVFKRSKDIIKFTDEDTYSLEAGKLIFPEFINFTSLGKVYSTQSSYAKLSRVIEDDFNKRLFETNTNLFAAKMTQISAQTPEMAHELHKAQLEIDKIKAEKSVKLGNVV